MSHEYLVWHIYKALPKSPKKTLKILYSDFDPIVV